VSDIMKLVAKLEARAKWLESEWKAGGDYPYLSARREETLYCLACIKDLSPSPSTSTTEPK
jgi:hypothetical protein